MRWSRVIAKQTHVLRGLFVSQESHKITTKLNLPLNLNFSQSMALCSSSSSEKTDEKQQQQLRGTHVEVIGLHWKTDEIALREAFEPFGKLEKGNGNLFWLSPQQLKY